MVYGLVFNEHLLVRAIARALPKQYLKVKNGGQTHGSGFMFQGFGPRVRGLSSRIYKLGFGVQKCLRRFAVKCTVGAQG